MKNFGEFFRSVFSSPAPQKPDILGPNDFPLTADGVKLSKPDGEPVAVARDTATATELAERLNEDEQRKEEDRWSA